MIFANVIQKADVADDADPRSSAPSAARLATLDGYHDSKRLNPTASIVVRVRVKVAAGTLATGGAANVKVWVRDEATKDLAAASQIWLECNESELSVPNDRAMAIAIPSSQDGPTVFVQLTGIVGTNADHVEIGVSAGGLINDDTNTNARLDLIGPARYHAAVVKSDATVLSGVRGIYVGGAGDVVITDQAGVDVTYVGVTAGTLLPIQATKVKNATTATNMVAMKVG